MIAKDECPECGCEEYHLTDLLGAESRDNFRVCDSCGHGRWINGDHEKLAPRLLAWIFIVIVGSAIGIMLTGLIMAFLKLFEG